MAAMMPAGDVDQNDINYQDLARNDGSCEARHASPQPCQALMPSADTAATAGESVATRAAPTSALAAKMRRETGELKLQCRTRSGFARLWRVWHVPRARATTHGRTRHRFDLAALRSLKPRTVRLNQTLVGRYVLRLEQEGRKPEGVLDWVELFCDCVQDATQLPLRSRTETLTAGQEGLSCSYSKDGPPHCNARCDACDIGYCSRLIRHRGYHLCDECADDFGLDVSRAAGRLSLSRILNACDVTITYVFDTPPPGTACVQQRGLAAAAGYNGCKPSGQRGGEHPRHPPGPRLPRWRLGGTAATKVCACCAAVHAMDDGTVANSNCHICGRFPICDACSWNLTVSVYACCFCMGRDDDHEPAETPLPIVPGSWPYAGHGTIPGTGNRVESQAHGGNVVGNATTRHGVRSLQPQPLQLPPRASPRCWGTCTYCTEERCDLTSDHNGPCDCGCRFQPPPALVLASSWLVPWLDPDESAAGERLSLGLTRVLSSTWVVLCYCNLPMEWTLAVDIMGRSAAATSSG